MCYPTIITAKNKLSKTYCHVATAEVRSVIIEANVRGTAHSYIAVAIGGVCRDASTQNGDCRPGNGSTRAHIHL